MEDIWKDFLFCGEEGRKEGGGENIYFSENLYWSYIRGKARGIL